VEPAPASDAASRWAARSVRTCRSARRARAQRSNREGSALSFPPLDRDRPIEVVAGFMSAAAIFAGCVALVEKPVLLAPVAILLSIIAAGIGGRHARLATIALAVSTVAFVAGMTIAVITDHALF
jgi:hypothetical protein